MTTILITGDLLWDYYLTQFPEAPDVYHQAFSKTVLHEAPGGAWFMQEMVARIFKGSELDHDIYAPKKTKVTAGTPVGKAYSLCELFEPFGGNDDKIWRIKKFLGCQPPSEYKRPLEIINSGKKNLTANPDILVIDDLGLGFRDQEDLWPDTLKDENADCRIIVKASAEFERSPLYKRLFSEKYAKRITIVLSADALRDRGAKISKGLSWDRTIEEIVTEFERGVSATDLACCRNVIVCFSCAGVASFTRCRLKLGKPIEGMSDDDIVHDNAVFERFLYHPDEAEGQWQDKIKGKVFGARTFLTAAIVRHVAKPLEYPLFISLGRALAAVRNFAEQGAGPKDSFQCLPNADRMQQTLNPDVGESDDKKEPADMFRTAFPHEVLNHQDARTQKADTSNLLRDVCGYGPHYVLNKAIDVVLKGVTKPLAHAPKARFGKYFAVDREEIERINMIRGLINAYINNESDKKPLSIAVFGPPGSGKSFAIKELVKKLMPKGFEPLEFNLSEFISETLDQLHEAFHQIRDESLKGTVPLVFWDEFDTENLVWLKYFLAPMQDAEFRSGALQHPFGKAIFIFAGGTSEKYNRFLKDHEWEEDKNDNKDLSLKAKEFKNKKAPDFISRLRGIVNIKGPNPIGSADKDPAYLIRRSVLLRTCLERYYTHLIDPATGVASVSTGVIHAFLKVTKFLHGARSLENVVHACNLGDKERFSPANLPPPELLQLHVTKDFLEHVEKGEFEMALIDLIAEGIHKKWCDQRKNEGWKHSSNFSRADKTDPRLLEYSKLDEKDKENNRDPSFMGLAILSEFGYTITRKFTNDSPPKYQGNELDDYAKIEHDRWVRDRILRGYEWCEANNRNDDLRLHQDIAPSDRLPPGEDQYDKDIAETILKVLWENGYQIVK